MKRFWKNLASFRSKSQRRSAQLERLNRKCKIESLEERLAFIAGTYALPGQPGAGFGGVVEITRDGGRCTGTLLPDARHVLTAAHCVDKDPITKVGDGQIDPKDLTVHFNVWHRGVRVESSPIKAITANIALPAGWYGNWQVFDLAVLTLPELAPLDAERFDIYRGTDEVGKSGSLMGYGNTGTGATLSGNPAGYRQNTSGTLRWGTNVIDDAPDDSLEFDLDDVGGTEAISAPGDSGGPFLIGNRIAGVISRGDFQPQFDGSGDPSYSSNAFGSTAHATRVSAYASFIDGVVNVSDDLVIDMEKQLAGNEEFLDHPVRVPGHNLRIYAECGTGSPAHVLLVRWQENRKD